MTSYGILLVLLSAVLHAAWNLLAKSSDDSVGFLRKALFWATICYLPVFVAFQFHMTYTPRYVVCVMSSSLVMGFYAFNLSNAYMRGHVSVVYPLARSFPILVLLAVTLFLGRAVPPIGVAGIVLIVGGCFMLPWKKFRIGPDGFALRNYMNRSCFWALGAALCTAGYSLIDKYAAVGMSNAGTWDAIVPKVNYVYIQIAGSWLIMELLARRSNPPRKKTGVLKPLTVGIILVASYSLIIMAFVTDPVEYVVSLRQISVVLGAVFSMIFIEKHLSRPRLIGVLIIFAGIILVGLA